MGRRWVGSNRGQAKNNNYFYLKKIKELKAISRYLKQILLSFRQITDSDRKLMDLACSILSPKKQLWDIPERCESFTWCSAQVKTTIQTWGKGRSGAYVIFLIASLTVFL